MCDHARGLIEDNDISGNARAGVAILAGGNPVVRVNRIHDGKDSGVLVSEKGRGRIEENEIFANLRAGVAILREGAPFVSRNKIFDGHDSGVLVCEQGMGSVVDNEIFSNFMAGVAIGHGGASTVKGNTIRDGSGGSLLCLSTQSRGLICANVIDQARAHAHTLLRPPYSTPFDFRLTLSRCVLCTAGCGCDAAGARRLVARGAGAESHPFYRSGAPRVLGAL